MDWCFSNEVEDLVVPRDYEQQEMISSQESWSQWRMTGFGGSDILKTNFNSSANMTREELTFNGGKNFYTSIDMADSNSERRKSNNSSMSQGLYNNGDSLLWNDQADYQQFTEEEARINHMDDLFFSSLLEEDSTKDKTDHHESMILGNSANMFEEGEIGNSAQVGSHGQSMGRSKYLKTESFSPSMDSVTGEASTSCQMPKQYRSDESLMEESVLTDLVRVTTQFTDQTRICFRDALYRLAESSKQPVYSCQDVEHMLISNDDILRDGETEASESKTNVIDRAIASLMFDQFGFEDNSNGNEDAHEEQQQQQQHRQGVSCCQHLADFDGDAEVPIAGMQEPPQSTAY